MLRSNLEASEPEYLEPSKDLPDPSAYALHLAIPGQTGIYLSFGHRSAFNLWDNSSKPAVSIEARGHDDALRGMVLHPHQPDRLLTWSEDGALAVWDLRDALHTLKASRQMPPEQRESALLGAEEALRPVFIRRGSSERTSVPAISKVLIDRHNPHRLVTWDEEDNVHAYNFATRTNTPFVSNFNSPLMTRCSSPIPRLPVAP